MHALRTVARWVACGFGTGLSPIASGTVGSLLGIPIVLVMQPLSMPAQVASCVALVLLAVPVCGVAEKHFGTKDDGRIVADEYLIFPICMLGLPPEPWILAMAFLVCRVMDIVKPPPARRLQDMHGGVGIVIDDVIATLYALVANHILVRLVAPAFGG